MTSVTFPRPVTFDAFGGPMTEGAALRLLEECAQLLDSVKECEALYVPVSDMGLGQLEAWIMERTDVLDCAMDVWQALANLLGLDCAVEADAAVPGINRVNALEVLGEAAYIYFLVSSGASTINASPILEHLADILYSTYTDDEIEDAYGECEKRNAAKGRI